MIWFWSTLLVTAIAVLSTANESSSGQEKLAVESILFVFAHPDDESMFFGPTIDYLGNQHSTRVHVLCLSNGMKQLVQFSILSIMCRTNSDFRQCRWARKR